MSDKVYVGRKCQSFQSFGEYEPFSRVTMWYGEGDNDYYTAGDDTGRTMECENPWATQQIVDNVLKQIKGFVYKPFEAKGCELDPAAELGDAVTICGTYTMIGSMRKNFKNGGLVDIGLPGGKEINHEYPYKSPQDRELKRRVKLGQKYQGVKIDRRDGLTITETDGETQGAKVVLNSKELTFYDVGGGKVLYFDPVSKTYKFMGELNVNNNFIVSKEGDVTMKGGITLDGPIKWGTNNTPNKKRYAASTSGPWHDTMQSGDIYCCDWEYTAEKWGEAYKFKGQDGTNGRPGSDADVTRANIVLAMIEAAENDGLYSVDGDDGKKYLGIRASAIKTGVLKAIDIEGCNYYSQNRVGQLKLSSLGGGVADLIFKNPGSDFDTFSVRDEIGSGTLSLYGIPIIRAGSIGGAWAELAENVTVHATFA